MSKTRLSNEYFNNWSEDDIVRFVKIWSASSSRYQAIEFINSDSYLSHPRDTGDKEHKWDFSDLAGVRHWLNDSFRHERLDIYLENLPRNRQRNWQDVAHKILSKGE